jgi:hypothetical protein
MKGFPTGKTLHMAKLPSLPRPNLNSRRRGNCRIEDTTFTIARIWIEVCAAIILLLGSLDPYLNLDTNAQCALTDSELTAAIVTHPIPYIRRTFT